MPEWKTVAQTPWETLVHIQTLLLIHMRHTFGHDIPMRKSLTFFIIFQNLKKSKISEIFKNLKNYFRHSSLAKFPTLGDSSSFSASNMWNQTLNLKKLGSSKLKLVDFRIESKLNEPRVEFADGKDSAVSKYQEIFRISTLFPTFWYSNMNLGCWSYICQIRIIFDQCRSNRISWLEIRRRIFSRS